VGRTLRLVLGYALAHLVVPRLRGGNIEDAFAAPYRELGRELGRQLFRIAAFAAARPAQNQG
jgi:hypothetical protein